MGVGVQRHVPAALPPGKTQYPLYRRLDGWTGAANLVFPPRIQSPDRPVRSVSLYRLHYPGPPVYSYCTSSFRKQYPLRLLFNQNWGCISCYHHACYTAVSLWKCLHRGFYGGSCTRVLRDGAVHSAGGKEMCHVWKIDTSRPMDCGDTQQDRFRFLTAEMSAREMAAVATYTQHG